MIGIGIIGFGYWGPNLGRNFEIPDRSRVVAISDLDPCNLRRAAERHPAARTTARADELIRAPDVDAVAIATPVRSHFELAEAALAAGKHVLVEKPMTETADQGKRLMDEAGRRGLVLMAEHTFIYTGAVQRMREIVRSGDLGKIYYYDSIRVNLGLFQSDVNVLWDLAIHDLSILDYVMDARPEAVSAVGISHIPGSPENLAYISLFLPDNAVAHINVNWLAPVKIRQTFIGGSRKMIIFDDMVPSEKLRVYDKGITVGATPDSIYEARVGYRAGDMWAPQLPTREALATEAEHFLNCLETGRRPITNGAMGVRLVEILERASMSMRLQGRPVRVSEEAA
jgi:predicted dehydrogenase